MTSSCQVLSVEMIFFLESNCKLNEGLSFITMTTINFFFRVALPRHLISADFLSSFFGFPAIFFQFFFKFLQISSILLKNFHSFY